MIHVQHSQFFWFGTSFRYLQDATKGRRIKGDGLIEENIKNFFFWLDALNLIITERVAEDQLREVLQRLSTYSGNDRLSLKDANELAKAMTTIRITLEAELQGMGAYMPTPKRLELKKLLEAVGDLFASGIYKQLPEIARYDFEQAGKCVAFELPTAAAFHILRGTEGVLRFYYEHMVRRKRVSPLTWGAVVNDLRKRTRTKKHEVLNNHLGNIGKSFRNPTQHPDATYDTDLVQDLWGVCIEAVTRMIKTLRKEKRI